MYLIYLSRKAGSNGFLYDIISIDGLAKAWFSVIIKIIKAFNK